MSYKEALDYLFSRLPMFSRVGQAAYKPGLERSYELAGFFGDPHKKLRAIHIAGTNGKGSTSHIIASVLQSAGYRTALYTSPHLTDFRERIRIDGRMIPREEVVEFVEKWKKADYAGDPPSFFELTMMMAFDWFSRQNVDYAVIEVGMGGRLDSTNIITPLLSVITNISFDHTQFLGSTLRDIAREKAGIIKPGVPAVIGEADEEVAEVFRSRAEEVGAPLREAFREFDPVECAAVDTPLKGPYQLHNINTASKAISELRDLGIAISTEAERCGFRDVVKLTGLRGRWQIIRESPLTICDTGHNEAGLKYNIDRLKKMISERPGASRLRFVIGFVVDKDVDHILPMFPRDADYYITRADIPRAMPVEVLADKCRSLDLHFRSYPCPSEAYAAALDDASPSDMIYIGGSTFIVADFLASCDTEDVQDN